MWRGDWWVGRSKTCYCTCALLWGMPVSALFSLSRCLSDCLIHCPLAVCSRLTPSWLKHYLCARGSEEGSAPRLVCASCWTTQLISHTTTKWRSHSEDRETTFWSKDIHCWNNSIWSKYSLLRMIRDLMYVEIKIRFYHEVILWFC